MHEIVPCMVKLPIVVVIETERKKMLTDIKDSIKFLFQTTLGCSCHGDSEHIGHSNKNCRLYLLDERKILENRVVKSSYEISESEANILVIDLKIQELQKEKKREKERYKIKQERHKHNVEILRNFEIYYNFLPYKNKGE